VRGAEPRAYLRTSTEHGAVRRPPAPATSTLKIVLNEQVVSLDNKQITVNAVDVYVLGAGNPLALPVGSQLILSSSTAGTS